jgi:hypothetical protein
MKQGGGIVVIVFSLLMHDLDGAGNNGRIQILKTGEYCKNYHDARTFYYYLQIPYCTSWCDGECRACRNRPGNQCPWDCFWGCQGTYTGGWETQEWLIECKAGCVESLNCNPPIANASHTGPGTVNNDPDSCPFNCNAGFYLANGVCVPCQMCDAGKWLQNCTGSDAGRCVNCDN